MIILSSVHLAFGGQTILDGITWAVKPGMRIGLIGPNGAGKTTILRLLSGKLQPDEGTVERAGDITVGYLEQDVQEISAEQTVLDEALLAFERERNLLAEEERLHRAIDEATDHESEEYARLLAAFDRVHTALSTFEVHTMVPRAEAVLLGLGFAIEDLGRPLATFSGGWRMRASLARLLLQRPDFLLLDEPTNHLDIDSIDWLENYLRSYPGTVVIVSHDRYFLDRMITAIAELSNGKLTEYEGNYTFYLEARVERRELQRAAYENQQKQIADVEKFIERFRYKATKARQVQSRIKMLEKVDRIVPPEEENASISFRFAEPPRSGRVVLELTPFSKSYPSPEGPIEVFRNAGPLTIERGDKIALIGRNGAGKSTLARILNGTESFEGELKLGYNVEMTYFAQHQADALDPSDTILDSLRKEARGHTETELRTLAGAFLFSGDDVFKPIKVLSGGERSRVALAKTLLLPANFLILDEPTNHLDIRSINVLIEALKNFSGTFVVVSHDRHFLDQVVNHVWRVEDGHARPFIGNYTDYLWQIEHGTAARLQQNGTPVAPVRKPASPDAVAEEARQTGPKTREQKRLEAQQRNSGPASEIRKLRKRFEQLERKIETAEAHRRDLEEQLADPELYADTGRYQETLKSYEAAESVLAEMYREWEEVGEALTALE